MSNDTICPKCNRTFYFYHCVNCCWNVTDLKNKVEKAEHDEQCKDGVFLNPLEDT